MEKTISMAVEKFNNSLHVGKGAQSTSKFISVKDNNVFTTVDRLKKPLVGSAAAQLNDNIIFYEGENHAFSYKGNMLLKLDFTDRSSISLGEGTAVSKYILALGEIHGMAYDSINDRLWIYENTENGYQVYYINNIDSNYIASEVILHTFNISEAKISFSSIHDDGSGEVSLSDGHFALVESDIWIRQLKYHNGKLYLYIVPKNSVSEDDQVVSYEDFETGGDFCINPSRVVLFEIDVDDTNVTNYLTIGNDGNYDLSIYRPKEIPGQGIQVVGNTTDILDNEHLPVSVQYQDIDGNIQSGANYDNNNGSLNVYCQQEVTTDTSKAIVYMMHYTNQEYTVGRVFNLTSVFDGEAEYNFTWQKVFAPGTDLLSIPSSGTSTALNNEIDEDWKMYKRKVSGPNRWRAKLFRAGQSISLALPKKVFSVVDGSIRVNIGFTQRNADGHTKLTKLQEFKLKQGDPTYTKAPIYCKRLEASGEAINHMLIVDPEDHNNTKIVNLRDKLLKDVYITDSDKWVLLNIIDIDGTESFKPEYMYTPLFAGEDHIGSYQGGSPAGGEGEDLDEDDVATGDDIDDEDDNPFSGHQFPGEGP